MEATLENLLLDYPQNVPVSVAAKLLGKPISWVQWGLESGALPFGSCVKREQAAFHISPRALKRYLEGDMMMPARELMDAIAEDAAKKAAKAAMREIKKEMGL